MRKIILVATMVLASASAQAGDRSLSLSGAAGSAAAPQTTTIATPAAAQFGEAAPATEAPKYVDRPPAIPAPPAPVAAPAPPPVPAPAAATAPAVTTPAVTTTASVPTATRPAPKRTAKVSRSRHKPYWSERRIIAELHRHGIYW